MVDMNSFFSLSYGLYIISTTFEGKSTGCVVNTLAQVTVEPPQLTVTIHKDNYTTELIQKSGVFNGVVLSENAGMDLIGDFGFKSGREVDKFDGFTTKLDSLGTPILTENVCATYSCKVVGSIDLGTHIIFVGEVVSAEVVNKDLVPMTYTYYHKVKKGQTPPKASSYKPEEKKGYRCRICGYVYEGEPLPEDYICPICKKGTEFFDKL